MHDHLAQRYPGLSPEEAWCREVIEHARSVLRAKAPEQMECALARLEAELQAHRETEAAPRQR
jgi:hypothetical protein